MFITDGKSLFGNTGIIVSLLILCIILYFSYNKCYTLSSSLENFDCISMPTDANCPRIILPTNARIQINGNSVNLKFTINNTKSIDNKPMKYPSKFMIILAQYDSNKINTGNNKFYLSNESEINSSTSTLKICSIVDGIPECKYTFTNIDSRDISGNSYYYKIGISAIYDDKTTSPYVMPYNINTSDKLFTITTGIENQNSSSSNMNTNMKNSNTFPISSAYSYDNTISTADGQYELIKSQLGNYPDNLLLDSQTVNDRTLSDLVDKSMAQALININVSV